MVVATTVGTAYLALATAADSLTSSAVAQILLQLVLHLSQYSQYSSARLSEANFAVNVLAGSVVLEVIISGENVDGAAIARQLESDVASGLFKTMIGYVPLVVLVVLCVMLDGKYVGMICPRIFRSDSVPLAVGSLCLSTWRKCQLLPQERLQQLAFRRLLPQERLQQLAFRRLPPLPFRLFSRSHPYRLPHPRHGQIRHHMRRRQIRHRMSQKRRRQTRHRMSQHQLHRRWTQRSSRAAFRRLLRL
jgi:hypothetical protein